MCAVFNRNQDSYETIEGIAQRAKQVKKAVAKGTQTVVGDVKQSLGMEVTPDNSLAQATNPKAQIPMNNSSTNIQDKQKLAQWRENVKQIDMEMKKAREAREKKAPQAQEANQAMQAQQAEKKQFEEKKKESVLMKLLKTKKGTKEGMQRASG